MNPDMSPAYDLTIATNRGDVGGGELMLLAVARAARELGLRVRVVGPDAPGDLVELAVASGLDTVALPASDRRSYAVRLRQWDARHRTGLLWCNGLLPVVATAGHPDRVAQLHQDPRGALQRTLAPIGCRGARSVVVPSAALGRLVAHTTVLPNWTGPIEALPARPHRPGAGRRIGFLGRLSSAKGVDVLADAVRRLRAAGEPVELVLGGDARFTTAADQDRVRRALEPVRSATVRLGWVPPEQLFAHVDVVAFPSTAPEPFGLVAAEAMAHGVVSVISDAGALPEVVGERHPWIARHGDPAHLAEMLRAALHAGPDTRDRVVREQRERWERLYSPEAGTERLGRLLSALGALEPDRAARAAGVRPAAGRTT